MQEKYDNNTIPAVDRKPDPDFLPFTNDFIFSLVMRDPTLCRELLALALPEEDFGEIKIMKSQNPLIDEPADGAAETANIETQADSMRSDTRALTVETQKSLKFVKDMHGVRFDAYIKSENVWAEVGRRVPRAKALHSWHETCLASAIALRLVNQRARAANRRARASRCKPFPIFPSLSAPATINPTWI